MMNVLSYGMKVAIKQNENDPLMIKQNPNILLVPNS